MRISNRGQATLQRFLLVCVAVMSLMGAPQAFALHDMYIVAHQDDDFFFMNPDILNSIARGNNVEVVYLTAGDRGDYHESYWREREKGCINAYTYMAFEARKLTDGSAIAKTPRDIVCKLTGAPLSLWTIETEPVIATSTSRQYRYIRYKLTLSTTQSISLIFLRLTDKATATGNGKIPLQAIWEDASASVLTVPADNIQDNEPGGDQDQSPPCNLSEEACLNSCADTACTSGPRNCALGSVLAEQAYTRQDLIEVLAELMRRFGAEGVSTLDSSNIYARHYGWNDETLPVRQYGYDNASHVFAAKFAFAARQFYTPLHAFAIYRGYNINIEAANLSADELSVKRKITNYYNIADHGACLNANDCGIAYDYPLPEYQMYWPGRQYTIREVRDRQKLAGPIGTELGSGQWQCLTNSAGTAVTVTACDTWGSTAQSRHWVLEPTGLLKNQGVCLTAVTGSMALVVTNCPSSPSPLTRWTLFSNGQLRGGMNGDCLDADASTGLVQLKTCANVPQQQWTLQFGAPNEWSSGTDFTDSTFPPNQGDAAYRSFGAVDFNEDGYADICMRRADGLWCALNNQSGTLAPWAHVTPEGAWSDVQGWGISAQGSTVTYGSPAYDGTFVCGRNWDGFLCRRLGNVLESYATPEYSDARLWDTSTSYYGSIRLADVNGDGRADVCGRGKYGIMCTLRYGAGFTSIGDLWTAEFSDSRDWHHEKYGTTIQFGDVDGDGREDVCGRGQDGIWCAVSAECQSTQSEPARPCFKNAHIWSYQRPWVGQELFFYEKEFSDESGWDWDPSYYRSIRLVDVNRDGRADLCGRSPAGLVCGLSTGTSFMPVRHMLPSIFTDYQGWLTDRYGSSLTFGDLYNDGGVGVCGRGYKVYCAAIRGN